MTKTAKTINFFLPEKAMKDLAERGAAEAVPISASLFAKLIVAGFLDGDLVFRTEDATLRGLGRNIGLLLKQSDLLEQHVALLAENQAAGFLSVERSVNQASSDAYEQTRSLSKIVAQVRTTTEAIWREDQGLDDTSSVPTRTEENRLNHVASEKNLGRRVDDVAGSGS